MSHAFGGVANVLRPGSLLGEQREPRFHLCGSSLLARLEATQAAEATGLPAVLLPCGPFSE